MAAIVGGQTLVSACDISRILFSFWFYETELETRSTLPVSIIIMLLVFVGAFASPVALMGCIAAAKRVKCLMLLVGKQCATTLYHVILQHLVALCAVFGGTIAAGTLCFALRANVNNIASLHAPMMRSLRYEYGSRDLATEGWTALQEMVNHFGLASVNVFQHHCCGVNGTHHASAWLLSDWRASMPSSVGRDRRPVVPSSCCPTCAYLAVAYNCSMVRICL